MKFLFLYFLTNLVFTYDYNSILSWAKSENITISPKLTLNYISNNNKSFFSNEDILINETIFAVPLSSILTPNKLLNLTSKKVKHILKKINLDYSNASAVFRTQIIKDQSLMALAQLYLSKKSPLHKHYSTYYDTFEDSIDNFPISVSEEEISVFDATFFGAKVIAAKEALKYETQFLMSNLSLKNLNTDDYIKFRVLSVSKSYNIENRSSIVPLADFFPLEPLNTSNVKWNYSTTDKIFKIYATKNIPKGEILLMEAPKLPNSQLLMFYGKTFENNFLLDKFPVNTIHPRWRASENVNITLLLNDFDLADESFIGRSIQDYRNIGVYYGMEHSDDTGYKMMLKNLEYFYDEYYIDDSLWYKSFLINENRINTNRVVDLERSLIISRINLISEIINDRAKEKEPKTDL